ncbi:hypothetical protein [Streptomyces sp. NBC_00038]|uniref:hypothetical protein n=1 Tax=Streptomyces sp. NBC_00038 TaxID=2903615 RepID=UPI0022526DAF|nr:hypothetical protein [Streptomyces sp. NBC_00038]MCX5557221.1 hypothetical protein [Streptomyces sp. NBC_00038]
MRIRTLEKKKDRRGREVELAALQRLSELADNLTEADSAKFAALVRQLRDEIGVGSGSEAGQDRRRVAGLRLAAR